MTRSNKRELSKLVREGKEYLIVNRWVDLKIKLLSEDGCAKYWRFN